jgi:hypothetical protein
MPPAIQRVLALAARGSGDAEELSAAVRDDPALVLALLCAARGGCPSSVIEAIQQLGVAAAVCICLRFRCADRRTAQGFDGMRHWRRGQLTVAYARAIAQCLRHRDAEQIQTAAALCHVAGLPGAVSCRRKLPEWLALQGVGDPLCALIAASRDEGCGSAAACVALAECMAEVWLDPGWEMNLAQARLRAGRLFGAVPDLCSWVFGVLGPQADELETLLRMRWPSRRQTAAWRVQAQRLLCSGE